MKYFELSSKRGNNGKRHFKAILYRIFPDSCVDELNQVGTMMNRNGITWLAEYCEKALPSIKGMSLRCEFVDEDRTELLGHGKTDIVDGVPVFEDAVVIGTFTKGYIEEIESDEGPITVCIGEGYIDSQCYHNFVEKLDADIANGEYPSGSIEIMHTEDNESIVYKYGYKDEGRIPTEFIHSGYALLGVVPADENAKLIELNEKHKEEVHKMDMTEIQAIVAQAVNEISTHTAEINACKDECEAKIADANEAVATAVSEKEEAVASAAKIQEALDEAKNELAEKYKEIDTLHEELRVLREELGKAKAAERIGELNAALAEFDDESKAYAKAEIDAFNENPIESEINSVVNKIYEGIGRKSKEASVVAESNAAKNQDLDVDDIFGDVCGVNTPVVEDDNIF